MSQSKTSTQFRTFARWRPLTESESVEGEIDRSTNLEQNNLYSITIQSPQQRSWKSQGAFKYVFEPANDNAKVFDDVVAQAISKVLEGSSCNFFAYGHTGSGKTHTVIGYDYEHASQLGLFLGAANRLFESLKTLDSKNKLGVSFSLFELRKNIAVDLLNNKTQCHIRQGADGRTHIRGETEMLEDRKVRVKPIVKQPCWTYEELSAKFQEALQERSTGSSTVHDQSSRTHAVLELEIVNSALVEARDALYERQAELVPVGKRATDIYLEETMKSLMKQDDGTWVSNPYQPVNQAVIDAAEAEKVEFERRVIAAEEHIESLLAAETCLGGKMIFVDLAGAEYHTEKGSAPQLVQQTPQEKQAGRQINTDLFALKEVIRAISSNQARVPYRTSPLTMVLREHFLGSKGGTSAMIVTVSPAVKQYTATLNSLKYGSLVGAACA